jgi:ParB-like chromosome segregation protein Spo0J
MNIRNRVKSLRMVPASDLKPNPKNWRTHPKAQQDALRGVLAEVGLADACLARELPDGSLMLIDGHLRAETLGDGDVPVLILDVNEAEADKILATLDPLAAMADSDAAKLDELLRNVDTGSEALQKMMAATADAAGLYKDDDAAEKSDADNAAFNYEQQYGVTVMCRDESHQKEVYDNLTGEGMECRVVVV